LLELFSVPGDNLPRCVPTRFGFGTLTAGGQDIALGLLTGDQAAAFYAGDAHTLGSTVVNIGTGAFVQIAAGAEAATVDGLLASIAYADEKGAQYVVEGTVNGAGNALSLVAEQLGLSASRLRSNLDRWMRAVSDPPLFLNGVGGIGSPWWQPDFVSRFIGAGGAAERMVAVCESIVFLLQVNLDRARAVVTPADIRVSGGVARSDALCQRLADLSRLTVSREQETETTLTGVARLLGGEPPGQGRCDVFEPQSNRPLRDRYERWLAAMREELPPACT
jgi:glycerol kinase